MANTPEEYAKWTDAFQNAFRDITEEHRSAVRSLEAQQKATDRVGFLKQFLVTTKKNHLCGNYQRTTNLLMRMHLPWRILNF